jgi:hypothetical protein
VKKYVLPALSDNCQAFQEDWEKNQKGELGKDMLFRWQALLVNAGHKSMAVKLTEANPKHTRAALSRLEKFILETERKAKADGKKCKPTRCITFGCEIERIEECHKKLLKNTKGEPSNSPAFFIRKENLEKYKAQEEFSAMKDEVFEKLVSGDTSAHMDETFLDLAAALKLKDSSAYSKLLGELSEMKVKLAAFKEEVNARSKSRSKEVKAAEAQEQKADLPDHLKPYAEGTDPSISFVEPNGYIIAIIHSGETSYPAQASNFVARIKEVREFDDDTEINQQFVIDGILEGTKKLPAITVNAKDFRSMNWVEKYWGNLLITSAPKARDIVRETIQRVSINAPATKSS